MVAFGKHRDELSKLVRGNGEAAEEEEYWRLVRADGAVEHFNTVGGDKLKLCGRYVESLEF